MVYESDLVALRRDTDVTDPGIALIQDVTKRILNPVTSVGIVDDSQFTGWSPIRPADIIQQFARRTSGERRTSQHALLNLKMRSVSAVQHHRQFACSGNCQ